MEEVGIYHYRHPLTDAAAYQGALAGLNDQIKAMARRDGGAVTSITSWTVNGSAAEGRAMVRDFPKLMLRAYNAEADNLVRGLNRTNSRPLRIGWTRPPRRSSGWATRCRSRSPRPTTG